MVYSQLTLHHCTLDLVFSLYTLLTYVKTSVRICAFQDQATRKEAQTMMNRTMQLNHSAARTMSCVSALSSYVFNAVRFFGALRFYFYYFFVRLLSSKRPLVS